MEHLKGTRKENPQILNGQGYSSGTLTEFEVPDQEGLGAVCSGSLRKSSFYGTSGSSE